MCSTNKKENSLGGLREKLNGELRKEIITLGARRYTRQVVHGQEVKTSTYVVKKLNGLDIHMTVKLLRKIVTIIWEIFE